MHAYIETNLALIELEQDLAIEQRRQEQIDHDIPVITESLIDFMITNAPRLPN
jgi:hypothetical protein